MQLLVKIKEQGYLAIALVLVGNAFVSMGISAELALAVCHRRFSAITALHIPRLRA
jgi:hypothetical protein